MPFGAQVSVVAWLATLVSMPALQLSLPPDAAVSSPQTVPAPVIPFA